MSRRRAASMSPYRLRSALPGAPIALSVARRKAVTSTLSFPPPSVGGRARVKPLRLLLGSRGAKAVTPLCCCGCCCCCCSRCCCRRSVVSASSSEGSAPGAVWVGACCCVSAKVTFRAGAPSTTETATRSIVRSMRVGRPAEYQWRPRPYPVGRAARGAAPRGAASSSRTGARAPLLAGAAWSKAARLQLVKNLCTSGTPTLIGELVAHDQPERGHGRKGPEAVGT
eukprot:7257222-Heterocapsa_arctica.AAC.1